MLRLTIAEIAGERGKQVVIWHEPRGTLGNIFFAFTAFSVIFYLLPKKLSLAINANRFRLRTLILLMKLYFESVVSRLAKLEVLTNNHSIFAVHFSVFLVER